MEKLMEKYDNFDQYKNAVDQELSTATENFVRIGYLLKMARDTDVIDGYYDSVNDFAMKEYGLEKTQVSRFMSINDRFSIDGNSQELLPQYKGYGSSKLAIMLQLPDVVNEELDPRFSKNDINAIKEQTDKDSQISDIEVMCEPQPAAYEDAENDLDKFVYQLGLQNASDFFSPLWGLFHSGNLNKETVTETLAPSGICALSSRIPGKGGFLMTITEEYDDFALTATRTGEKTSYNKDDLIVSIQKICRDAPNSKVAYVEFYDNEYPTEIVWSNPTAKAKKVIAPQQIEPKKKAEHKKVEEPKAEKAEIKLDIPKDTYKFDESNMNLPEEEEQLPGQIGIEEHLETLPEDIEKVDAEIVQKDDGLSTADRKRINNYYVDMIQACEAAHYNMALGFLSRIEFVITSLKDQEEISE